MPRAKHSDPPVKKTITIRESLVTQTDLSLIDALTNEPAYGAWSSLVEELLEKWLKGEVKLSSFSPVRVDLSDLGGTNGR